MQFYKNDNFAYQRLMSSKYSTQALQNVLILIGEKLQPRLWYLGGYVSELCVHEYEYRSKYANTVAKYC